MEENVESSADIIDQIVTQLAGIRETLFAAEVRLEGLTPDELKGVVSTTVDLVSQVVRYGKAIRREEAPRGLEPGGCTQSQGMIRG